MPGQSPRSQAPSFLLAVELSGGRSARLRVAEGARADELALAFAAEHALGEGTVAKLVGVSPAASTTLASAPCARSSRTSSTCSHTHA